MQPNVQTLEVETGAFRVADDGPKDAPALVLSNSLGTTLEMWDAQAQALSQDFRVIRYDTRGHGGSVVSAGPYDLDELTRDVLLILDALEIQRAAFCGISMGGITGLSLALKAPERITHLVVANSAAKIGEAQAWHERAATIRADGQQALSQLAASAPQRWFTPDFVAANPDVVQRAQAWVASAAPEGYAACCEALAEADLRADIHRIAAPTLLIAGDADPVTTVAHAQAMQAAIAASQLLTLPASHLSNLEAPDAFTAAVRNLLTGKLA